MDSFRKLFTFSKGERLAIVTILLCIAALLAAVFLHRPRVALDGSSLHNLDSLLALRQAAVDEMQQRTSQVTDMVDLQPFPFNPNTMTEDDGRRMGLTERQVRNIINYRDKGGKFFSKQDLAKLYTISEDDYAQLEPFIVLPEVTRRDYAKQKTETSESQYVKKELPKHKEIPTVDLNTADSALFVQLPQIGAYTAARIVAFREKLGGFINKEQLLDVKGMDTNRYKAIQPYIIIGEVSIGKIDVNRASFKVLVNHPYLNYNQVKLIVNYREKRGMIRDWEQLNTLVAEEGEVNPLLQNYLKY